MRRTLNSKFKPVFRRVLFASSVVILFLLFLPNQALAAPRSISGTVKNASNAAIAGVTMTLSGAGTGTTTTAVDGTYTLNATSSGTYTVTPSKAGYIFSPSSLSYTNMAANQTAQNYIGTLVYSISGHIQNASAFAISGATVTLSGGQSSSTTTDASGNYSFPNLPATNNYTLSPLLANYTFSPTSLTYNNLSANQTTAAFTGTSTNTYAISGHIQNASAVAISGVTVMLSGGQSSSTSTDASGNYSFASLPSTNNYTVTPSKTNYTFSPTSLTSTNLIANQAAQNFTATATVIYTISGSVKNSSNVAITGVTMTLSGGQSGSTTTDPSGAYSLASILPGMDYTVTPSKTSYTFSPTSLSYTNLSANQAIQDFTATAAVTYTISGSVKNSSNVAISGVTMTLSGGQSGSTTTGSQRRLLAFQHIAWNELHRHTLENWLHLQPHEPLVH